MYIEQLGGKQLQVSKAMFLAKYRILDKYDEDLEKDLSLTMKY